MAEKVYKVNLLDEFQSEKKDFKPHIADSFVRYRKSNFVEHQQFFQEVQGRRAIKDGDLGDGPI